MSYQRHPRRERVRSLNLFWALIPALSLASTACSGVDAAGGGSEMTSTSHDQLWLSGAKWANGIVPVCWDSATTTRSDFALRSRQVRDIANDSWPRVANVEFTGWGTCPASTPGMVRIILDDTGAANAGGIGFSSAGLVMHLGTARSDFTGSMVPHEFGHVLGFSHEMARADFADNPATDCHEGNVAGDPVNTPADMQSIMASTGYCQENSTLSMWDIVGVRTAYGARTNAARPLVIGWNGTRNDNATVSTAQGVSDLNGAAYAWAFAEGWVFNDNIPGTAALKLYWSNARQDNVSVATAQGQADAVAAGYTLIRTEGYVFTSQQPGTVPLKLYWNGSRQDNMTVASAGAEQAAIAAGYTLIRTEGYIPASTPYALGWVYWSGARQDNLLTAGNSQGAIDANSAGYAFAGYDGAFWVNNYPGTTSLQTWWSGARLDNFETATSAGISSAQAAGYSLIRTEGYLYSSSTTGMSAYKSYFNGTRNDNFTTMERSGDATSAGYALVRTEGYGVPIND